MFRAYDIDKISVQQQQFRAALEPDDYRLKPSIERDLNAAIEDAPMFARLASAAKRLIRMIHSVPDLYEDARRRDLEFYVGRAGGTAQHVFNRFEYRGKRAVHEGGMIVCRCPTVNVPTWESVAVKVVKRLHERGRLCVANLAAHGGGAVPSHEESVIYLTWRLLEGRISIPSRRDVDEIAIAVGEEMAPRVSIDSVRRSLAPATKPNEERERIEWALRHDGDWSDRATELRSLRSTRRSRTDREEEE